MNENELIEKCNEIHRIICYLLNDNNIAKIEPTGYLDSVYIGLEYLHYDFIENHSEIECALAFLKSNREW